MQTTSATWKTLWASGSALLEVKAVIGGTDRSAEICAAPVIRRATMQNGLSVGNVVSATCTLTLRTTAAIARSASAALSMRLTDGTTASEWLPAGTFYISRRAKDPVTGLLTLECYDALLKANAAWTPSAGSWPRAMSSVVSELASLLGVSVDSRTTLITGASYVIDEPTDGTSIRDVLSDIAACNGGNWIITPEGKLRLVPLISAAGAEDAVSDALDVEAVLDRGTLGDAAAITGVRCTVDGVVTLTGDDTGIVVDVDIAPVIAADLAQTLIGMTHQPFRLPSAVYDPAVELGDYVRYNSTVAGVLCAETAVLSAGPRGELSAPDPAELADEYPYIGGTEKALTLAKAYAREAVEALDDDLTQQEIFDRLTDNGAAQGMVLVDGQLYVNATYMRSGTIDGGVVNAKLLNIVDANGNVIARFNNVITLGQPTDAHAELDFNSFEIKDYTGNVFFIAGDMRDATGYLTIVDTFTGDGRRTSFELSASTQDSAISSVTIDGTATTDWTYGVQGVRTIHFTTAPADGAQIVVTYDTDDPVYRYDLGTRRSGTNVGINSVAEGANVEASGFCSHAEGKSTTASGNDAHAEGQSTTASAPYSHAEGSGTTASGMGAHAEGGSTTASGGFGSHAEGYSTTASGQASHAEGLDTMASGHQSHAEGYNTTASGGKAHAEGFNTTASGSSAHAEGYNTTASREGAHAEGDSTTASGAYSHAEGGQTTASGWLSHAEGSNTTAYAHNSHAEGSNTYANNRSQHVFGEYNVIDTSTAGADERGTYIEIVGKGTADNARSNARTLDWSGNEYIAGTLTTAGSTGLYVRPVSQRAYIYLAPQGDYASDIRFVCNSTSTWSLSSRGSSDNYFFGLFNHSNSTWPVKVNNSTDVVTLSQPLPVGSGGTGQTDVSSTTLSFTYTDSRIKTVSGAMYTWGKVCHVYIPLKLDCSSTSFGNAQTITLTASNITAPLALCTNATYNGTSIFAIRLQGNTITVRNTSGISVTSDNFDLVLTFCYLIA